MSGKSMRNFSGGLLVATAILSLVYFLSPSQAASTEKLSADDAKSLLESEGYVVHTQQEWDASIAAVTAAGTKVEEVAQETEKQAKATKETKPKESKAKKATEKKKTEAPKQAEPEKVVKTLTITVAQGMYISDVGNALVEAQFIPNALEFSQRVESLGLSSALRPGSYEVNSGMTMDEMISVIFKK